jgi:hypothetical protein
MANVPWGVPQPAAVGGLNSIMVYGENLQVAVGLNHQLAVGSNVQICVNPAAIEELLNVPPSQTFVAMCGSGLGGNMQFTVGSSTNVVWGRQFQINVGPEPITRNFNERHPLARGFCMLLCIAILAHIIAYGLISDDNARATEVIIFQVLTDLILAGFMRADMLQKTTDMTTRKALCAFFSAQKVHVSLDWEGFRDLVQYAALLSALVLPPIAIALEESHFTGDTQDQTTPPPAPPACPPPPCP